MRGRTRWEALMDKRDALKKAENEGLVADSMAYRIALVHRFHTGEITFEQMQAELKQTKLNAKKNGLLTRSQAFNRG